jgi:two-component system, OmpR family, sensor kinase
MLSLRLKLTVYYLAILSAILLLFSITIYTYISRSLVKTIDESLGFQVKKIEQLRTAANAGEDITNLIAGGGGEGDAFYQQLSVHVMQVIDESGFIIEQWPEVEEKTIPVEIGRLLNLEVGRPGFDSIRLPSGEVVRVATLRASAHMETSGTYFIRIGQSLVALQVARRRLVIVLGVAVPLALLLGSLGGLLLANQALRPVDRITRAAEQIGGGDLTERVPSPAKMDEIGRLAATFNHMISRLQAAFERQRQFTSDASHELRTPLAVMRGEIEISLRRDRPAEEYRRVLTSNLEELVRLSRLVEDLLMLARADSGRVELRREPVNLNLLCQQMVEYITPLALQRQQALLYEPRVQPDAVVLVSADLQRIKQLLLNLLDNAIKYTDLQGAVTLSLDVQAGQAIIAVADSGRGIPAEDLPHIFERFFRRSASTSDRSAPGFGLGLSIVKWIVDSHGGRIEAKSELGKGTTFFVHLPLSAEP